MLVCDFPMQCKIHPIPATGTCNNCRAFTCDKCSKVGNKCPYCKMDDIVPPEKARNMAATNCVNHPGIRASAPCLDCKRIFCPSCLNPFGQCLLCGGKNPKVKPTMAPEALNAKEAKSKGKRKYRSQHLGAKRLILSLLVIVGIGAVLNWQYSTVKKIVSKGGKNKPNIAANVGAYDKAVRDHGMSTEEVLDRIESGKYSKEDSDQVDALMRDVEGGTAKSRMGAKELSRLERAKEMVGDAGDQVAPEEFRPRMGRLKPGAYEGPPIRLRVGSGPDRAPAEARVAQRGPQVGILITSPGPGQRVHGNAIVAASVQGGGAVDRVEFQVNGAWQGIANRAPFRFDWDTSAVRNGAVTLRMVAYDSAGSPHASRPVKVLVQN